MIWILQFILLLLISASLKATPSTNRGLDTRALTIDCRTSELTRYFPDPEDCSSFLQCSAWMGIQRKSCGNLYFNPKTQVCDWPIVVQNMRPECKVPQVPTPYENNNFHGGFTPIKPLETIAQAPKKKPAHRFLLEEPLTFVQEVISQMQLPLKSNSKSNIFRSNQFQTNFLFDSEVELSDPLVFRPQETSSFVKASTTVLNNIVFPFNDDDDTITQDISSFNSSQQNEDSIYAFTDDLISSSTQSSEPLSTETVSSNVITNQNQNNTIIPINEFHKQKDSLFLNENENIFEDETINSERSLSSSSSLSLNNDTQQILLNQENNLNQEFLFTIDEIESSTLKLNTNEKYFPNKPRKINRVPHRPLNTTVTKGAIQQTITQPTRVIARERNQLSSVHNDNNKLKIKRIKQIRIRQSYPTSESHFNTSTFRIRRPVFNGKLSNNVVTYPSEPLLLDIKSISSSNVSMKENTTLSIDKESYSNDHANENNKYITENQSQTQYEIKNESDNTEEWIKNNIEDSIKNKNEDTNIEEIEEKIDNSNDESTRETKTLEKNDIISEDETTISSIDLKEQLTSSLENSEVKRQINEKEDFEEKIDVLGNKDSIVEETKEVKMTDEEETTSLDFITRTEESLEEKNITNNKPKFPSLKIDFSNSYSSFKSFFENTTSVAPITNRQKSVIDVIKQRILTQSTAAPLISEVNTYDKSSVFQLLRNSRKEDDENKNQRVKIVSLNDLLIKSSSQSPETSSSTKSIEKNDKDELTTEVVVLETSPAELTQKHENLTLDANKKKDNELNKNNEVLTQELEMTTVTSDEIIDITTTEYAEDNNETEKSINGSMFNEIETTTMSSFEILKTVMDPLNLNAIFSDLNQTVKTENTSITTPKPSIPIKNEDGVYIVLPQVYIEPLILSTTTSIPVVTTVTLTTTSIPVVTTVSSITTSIPVVTTVSSITTSIPVVTTVSSITTSIPVVTTVSSITTSIPVVTTVSSITTSIPVVTTVSSITTSISVVTTNSSNTKSIPSVDTTVSTTTTTFPSVTTIVSTVPSTDSSVTTPSFSKNTTSSSTVTQITNEEEFFTIIETVKTINTQIRTASEHNNNNNIASSTPVSEFLSSTTISHEDTTTTATADVEVVTSDEVTTVTNIYNNKLREEITNNSIESESNTTSILLDQNMKANLTELVLNDHTVESPNTSETISNRTETTDFKELSTKSIVEKTENFSSSKPRFINQRDRIREKLKAKLNGEPSSPLSLLQLVNVESGPSHSTSSPIDDRINFRKALNRRNQLFQSRVN